MQVGAGSQNWGVFRECTAVDLQDYHIRIIHRHPVVSVRSRDLSTPLLLCCSVDCTQ